MKQDNNFLKVNFSLWWVFMKKDTTVDQTSRWSDQ